MKILCFAAAGLLCAASSALAQATPQFATATFASHGTPRAVVTADFNGDGHLDFAAANNSPASTVEVYLGHGDGSFTPLEQDFIAAGAFGIASADFNHDGRADLVVTSADSSTITILLWTGSGFAAAHTMTSPGGDPRFVVAADLNRDGNPDIAYASFACGCVETWTSNRTGDVWTYQGQVKTGAGAHGIAVADMDLDGLPDLVVTNSLSATASFLHGFGDGTFFVRARVQTGAGPRSVTIGDFNRDGIPDFATANTTGNGVSVFVGLLTGTTPFSSRTIGATISSPRDVLAVDVNGDAILDLVVAGYGENHVVVLTGDGSGQFGTSGKRFDVRIGSSGGPRTLAAGDLNEDGRVDLLAGNQTAGTVTELLNNTAFAGRP